MAGSCLLCDKEMVKRRPIHSVSNSHILPVLQEKVRELFGGPAVASILSEDAALCQGCLRNLESLIQLRAKLNQKEKDVCEQVQRVGVKSGVGVFGAVTGVSSGLGAGSCVRGLAGAGSCVHGLAGARSCVHELAGAGSDVSEIERAGSSADGMAEAESGDDRMAGAERGDDRMAGAGSGDDRMAGAGSGAVSGVAGEENTTGEAARVRSGEWTPTTPRRPLLQLSNTTPSREIHTVNRRASAFGRRSTPVRLALSSLILSENSPALAVRI